MGRQGPQSQRDDDEHCGERIEATADTTTHHCSLSGPLLAGTPWSRETGWVGAGRSASERPAPLGYRSYLLAVLPWVPLVGSELLPEFAAPLEDCPLLDWSGVLFSDGLED